MILEALAIYGGLSLVNDLTPGKYVIRENWKDRAGIQWTPLELCKFTREKRVSLFGYDPLEVNN